MQKIKTSSLIYVAVLGLLTLFRILQLGLWVDSATGFSKNFTGTKAHWQRLLR